MKTILFMIAIASIMTLPLAHQFLNTLHEKQETDTLRQEMFTSLLEKCDKVIYAGCTTAYCINANKTTMIQCDVTGNTYYCAGKEVLAFKRIRVN